MRKKIEKWQEKGPAKQGRVLPVPDMEPKKRRGGKRARKYKERYGLTDTKKVLLPRLHVSGQPDRSSIPDPAFLRLCCLHTALSSCIRSHA